MRVGSHNHYHKKASGNLLYVFILNILLNVVVIIGGLITNSVAILADCLHDLSDTISVGLAWVLERISQKGSDNKYTYGYKRFSLLGAVITSVFVVVISVIVIYESLSRLFAPVSPNAEGMVLVAILGLIFKGISAFILHGGETFNEKAILYHVLGDIFKWIGLLVVSVVLIFVDLPILDPLVSIVISLWLIYNLGKTLIHSLTPLLQRVPFDINVDELKNEILSIKGVKSIEGFHLWSLDGLESVLTIKLDIDNGSDEELIKNKIKEMCIEKEIIDITIEFI